MKYFDLLKEKMSIILPAWMVIMLVSMGSIYIQEGYINRDGLLYLKQAYLISQGFWAEAISLYSWPFFSVLLAFFYKITNIDLQFLGHIVDLSLFGIATFFYLKILDLIYKDKYIIFYGSLILLSFIPIMDDYLGMILRDHGLWAGCMMGTYFYLKFSITRSFKYSLAWQFAFILSGLFRPEGLVFLIFLPFWDFFNNKIQRGKIFILNISIPFLLSLTAFFIFILFNNNLINILLESRLMEFLTRPILFLNHLIEPLPIESKNKYISDLLQSYGLLISYSLLISLIFFKWFEGLGFLHFGLFVFSLYFKRNNILLKHIYFFLILSFILVGINLFNVYVLSNRYWGFHWWWILILNTSILHIFFEKTKFSISLKFLMSVLLLILILNSLIDNSTNLEKEIAEYIKDNNIGSIYFHQGTGRIKYYVNKNPKEILEQQDISNFSYTIFKTKDYENIVNEQIIKSFPDKKPKFYLIKNAK